MPKPTSAATGLGKFDPARALYGCRHARRRHAAIGIHYATCSNTDGAGASGERAFRSKHWCCPAKNPEGMRAFNRARDGALSTLMRCYAFGPPKLLMKPSTEGGDGVLRPCTRIEIHQTRRGEREPGVREQ